MAFLQKIIILLAGCSIILAKSSYDYEYQPYKSFHVPWAINYPQPLISIDGAWPISYSYPIPREDDYSSEETNYHQELLTKSLNKALTKLNQLLPPWNLQETTPFPPSTKPEVLAEALNKAIDRLGVLLTRRPLPLNKPEVTTTTTTEVTVESKQPTMAPEKVSDSVSSAINELNKLFATLPEELKAKPNQTLLTNSGVNKPIVLEFQPMRPAPFLSEPLFYPELKPNLVNTKDSSTEGTLFTSNHFVEQNIVTEKVEENNNNVALTVPSRNSGENEIFTTVFPIVETSSIPPSVEPTENVVDTTVLPKENTVVESTILPTENNVESTYPPIRDIETDTTTIRNDVSSASPAPIPEIDIRFGEEETVRSDFIFPDEFDQMVSQNKKPTVQQEVDLGSRFGSTSTPLTLEYKPSRPPFHPDIFPPNPSPRPQFVSNLQTSTNFELGDRNKVTTVYTSTQTQRPVQNNQNPQIVLGYKPSRPPFHPDVYPPHPTARPQTDSNLQTGTNFELGDRNKPAIVDNQQQPTQTQRPIENNQNTPIVLEYKPSRPPFHPDIFPPHPTARPQTDSNLQTGTNFELGDRNKPTIVNNEQQPTQNVPDTTSTTTEIFFTTTQNNEPYRPTHYYSTPISLEYKPTRPFYAPHPVFYPRPIIPPGTPWPASSTERPKN